MAKMFIPVIWGGTFLNMISTFYGFQILLKSQNFRADLFAAVATLGVICCAMATAHILLATTGFSGVVWKLIWLIFIAFGFFAALFGNFAMFPPPVVAADFSVIFKSEMATVGGEAVFWLTLVFAWLSMMHSQLPPGYGGPDILRMFRAHPPS